MKTLKRFIQILLFALAVGAAGAAAQTIFFTYQGKLTDAGTPPASATYDFEFSLCGLTCLTPLQTIQRLNVPVTNGIFTVALDFDAAHFSGGLRFLRIRVRRTSGDPWTQLSPDQAITSAPYAIKSLNAASADNSLLLGGVAANQFVQTNDARLSDDRNPLPNSANYIQNRTTPQTNTDFNISGNGRANIFDAAAYFSIAGFPVLRVQSANQNTFVGNTGQGGNRNTFLGDLAGAVNTGSGNSFFGSFAGASNQTAMDNSFFGLAAGNATRTGCCNSFFGKSAGQLNDSGQLNAFFGGSAGFNNSSGSFNVFVGIRAGDTNTTGRLNTMLGYQADVASNDLVNATAVGANSSVSQSDSLILGSLQGNTKVGIGTTAPAFKLQVIDASNAGLRVQTNTAGGTVASFGGNGVFDIDASGIAGGRFRVLENGNIGIGTDLPTAKLEVNGVLRINSLGSTGGTQLCRNGFNQISNCSSSLRYKTNIAAFDSGLSFVNRLHPVAFDWKTGGMRDIGFIAEEIAEINPLFVTFNESGEIEGVKYDRLSVVFANAFKEQQTQIERQQNLIEKQQRQIDALRRLVCAANPSAEICKEEQK
jgi:hypothetical protein